MYHAPMLSRFISRPEIIWQVVVKTRTDVMCSQRQLGLMSFHAGIWQEVSRDYKQTARIFL